MIPGVRSPLPGFDVLRRIETRNFPAFLVGGAVRDLLWGWPFPLPPPLSHKCDRGV